MKSSLSEAFIQSSISLDLLRTFVVFVQSDGVESAAQALNVTQASVSQQLQRLEKELKTELFKKEGRKKILTDYALRLSQDLVPPLSQMDKVLRDMNRKKQTFKDQRINILFEPELVSFMTRLNIDLDVQISVHSRPQNFSKGISELKSGQADFFISETNYQERGFGSVLLAEQPLCWVWPQKVLPGLENLSEVRAGFRGALHDRGFLDGISNLTPSNLAVETFVENWDTLTEIIRKFKCWSVLPREWAMKLEPEFSVTEIPKNDLPPLKVFILYSEKTLKQKYKKDLLSSIQN